MLRKTILRAALVLALAAPAVATPAAADTDLLKKSWSEIEAQAKAEGELTWFVWYQQPSFREVVASFTADTGIKVTIPEGDITGNRQKLLAESGRKIGDIDVYADGGDAFNTYDPTVLFLGPMLPILPENTKLTDKINGGDAKGYGVAFWGNQTGMAYDSRRVRETELPNTVEQLSSWMAAHPRQLGFNYENGGSGPSFAQNIARGILGITPDSKVERLPDMKPVWDWFNSRKDEYTITGSNADSLTRLNDGEFLLVPAWEDHLAGLQRSKAVGDFIKIYVPAWGMNGGGNMVAIPKNAPHPAAALVFVAWLTSAKTQTLFNQRSGTSPTNTDADLSKALIPADQRKNTRDWQGPLPGNAFMPAFIENVIQR
jgi:putative spermidine/putrescine transport system substrate-binding protein